MSVPAGLRTDIRGRFEQGAQEQDIWGQSENERKTKLEPDRNFDVQPHTGYASSTVARGQWVRGVVLYGPTPVMQLHPTPVYDPTDPRTWDSARKYASNQGMMR